MRTQLARFLRTSGFDDKLFTFLYAEADALEISPEGEEQKLEVYEAYQRFTQLFDGEFSDFMQQNGCASMEEMFERVQAEDKADERVGWEERDGERQNVFALYTFMHVNLHEYVTECFARAYAVCVFIFMVRECVLVCASKYANVLYRRQVAFSKACWQAWNTPPSLRWCVCGRGRGRLGSRACVFELSRVCAGWDTDDKTAR